MSATRVQSDEERVYREIGQGFSGRYETVCHKAQECRPNGSDVTKNTVERFFSLLKRSLYRVRHHVFPKHLHHYLSQREFVHNARAKNDGDRIDVATRGVVGKRLRYDEEVGG